MKRAKIKSIPYEEFKDNETYEKLVEELNAGGANIIVRKLDDLIDWGRSISLWPLTFATSCCGIEFMAVCAARYDIARFGFEVTRNSPRQADVILVCGTITTKMAPVLRRLYDQMADPKYVVAIGGCSISGGPFTKSYHVLNGVDKIIPVDVYVPGCPPRPEAFLVHDERQFRLHSGQRGLCSHHSLCQFSNLAPVVWQHRCRLHPIQFFCA